MQRTKRTEVTVETSRVLLVRQGLVTRSGFAIEVHETELAPELAPHPPNHHAHEEMVLIREGTLEVTISTRARYFILALGRE